MHLLADLMPAFSFQASNQSTDAWGTRPADAMCSCGVGCLPWESPGCVYVGGRAFKHPFSSGCNELCLWIQTGWCPCQGICQ